ncbi:cupin domain-containing protein [Oscillospiraceae bacterium LTW-04]|nr:cupin domain-containing protein [Oscillospiraceae bacterium MB24-C1]
MNLFSIPERTPEEFCQLLALSDSCRIERTVSQGHHSPKDFWYDQAEDELVCLISGSALLSFERCQVFLTAGDMLFIPAHLRHRVEATSHAPPCVWLCIFGRFNQPTPQENRP